MPGVVVGSNATVQVLSGTAVGPYVVERKLAQGGMSVLFLAHDAQLDRPVALKMLAEEVATHSSRARMLREAKTLASVDHPGIVRIYGAGEHDDKPWIAMELVRGTDLKRLLAERGTVPAQRALRWVLQATDALAAAHDVGVVHRDLKPSNLLLTHDDRIKVVDFGVAKRRVDAAGTGGDVLTSQGEVLGTPAYLSPEQLEHGLADERSDVWGLGCVLYELCVGAPPFGRANSAATTAAILRDEPFFPSGVAGPVVEVVQACLRKNSFARVASMRELGALVRDALEQRGPAGMSSRAPERHSSSRGPSVRPSAFPPGTGTTRGSEPPRTTTDASGVRGADAAPGVDRAARSTDLPSRAPLHRPSTPSRPFRASAPSAFPGAAGPERTRSDSTATGLRTESSASFRPDAPSATMRVPRGRLKGTAVRAGLLWFAEVYGADALARALTRASVDARAIIRLDDPSFGIVASGWYETRLIGELLLLLEESVHTDDSDAWASALAESIARDNVGGVYRSLFRLVTTPPMLEANAQRVWRTYCDEGILVAHAPRPGELQIEIRHWGHHHPQTCRVVGFAIQHVLRAVGYEALVIERTQCLADGDPACAFEGMYLPK